MIEIRLFLRAMLTILAGINSFFLSISADLGVSISLLYSVAAAIVVLIAIFTYSSVKSRRRTARFRKIRTRKQSI